MDSSISEQTWRVFSDPHGYQSYLRCLSPGPIQGQTLAQMGR